MFRNYGLLIVIVGSCLLAACAPAIPREALQLSPESLQDRNMQTRRFNTADEGALLGASSALLQDMGFAIEESTVKLGVLVGSKERDATNAGQVVGAIAVALLTGAVMPMDKSQVMRASIVTKPLGEGKGTAVRVTFQRIVVSTQGRVTIQEGIKDSSIYQEFFSKLSKAVFLQANEV
jgi:hypothetical protein